MNAAMQVLSPQDLGKVNRSRVLQALVDHGPLSRADLARFLNVPRASIGVIVKSLVGDGTLQEERAPEAHQGRGKPPRPLWFAESAGLSGAISIEATRIAVGVVNARGTVLAAGSAAIEPGIGHEELVHVLFALIDEVLAPRRETLVGVGLVVPAQCDPSRGVIELCTVLPALTGSPLPELIAGHLGREVSLEQDVRALACAERWFGRGRGEQNFAVMQIDVGIGVGMVMGGHVFPGPDVPSPQLGHTCVDKDGLLCSCGLHGCWETIASLSWLRTEAGARGIVDSAWTTPAALQELADSGDAVADAVLSMFASHLALGLANIAQTMRTPLVILEGAIAGAGERFVDELGGKVRERLTTDGPLRVVPSALPGEPLLLGACATSLSGELGVLL